MKENIPLCISDPFTAPVRGANGAYGVVYFDFPSPQTLPRPLNGLPGYPTPGRVTIGDGSDLYCTNIAQASACASRFAARMQRGGWTNGLAKPPHDYSVHDLTSTRWGGNDVFSQVTVGLLMSHGCYGTSPDYNPDASQTYDTYLASDNPADGANPWIRLSQFGFGGSLRYMAILACEMLTDANNNYSSMNGAGVLPVPSNLHLLCGCSSEAILTEDIGEKWADNMCGKPGGLFGIGSQTPQTVQNSWFFAGSESYSELGTGFAGVSVFFRVAGWSSAMNDTLANVNDSTSGSIVKSDAQVNF